MQTENAAGAEAKNTAYDSEDVQALKKMAADLEAYIGSAKDADEYLASQAINDLKSAMYYAVKLFKKKEA